MHRAYHHWWSPQLDREMELLVFGHAGARVIVFPTRAGRFYDYENWGLVATLAQHLAAGWLQLFCVDSIDRESLYNFSRPPQERIARHAQYERYILEEVLPLTAHLNPNPTLVAHGCSLGAFHAANIALRHPAIFSKIVALSGRYDLTVRAGRYPALFDGYYDEAIYFHTPTHFVPHLCDEYALNALRHQEIILVVGEHDPCLLSAHQLSQALWDKNIWHALHIWRGEAHALPDWLPMVGMYL
ncbi:esterase family protein [Candidatus Gracilibacteria bacterium]|nr:esterase family protein [Candidatus Gracilibacteria bacterium]